MSIIELLIKTFAFCLILLGAIGLAVIWPVLWLFYAVAAGTAIFVGWEY